MTIDAPLLQAIARAFHHVELGATRAAELAVEAERLDGSLRAAAASRLNLDSDPAACTAVLERGAS
jgi:hypothetical protein